MTTFRALTPKADESTVMQAPAQPVITVPPDPQAGGSYLRDPVTGALTPNPATATPTSQE